MVDAASSRILGSYEELDTRADYDKFVGSSEDNNPEMRNGRSKCMIDCRKFHNPDSNKRVRKHIGRNPRITKSIMRSKNYHELHSRLYDGMPRFLLSKNIVIIVCRTDVIVLLRTLSCCRTRWLVTVDINTPFSCCTCLNRISCKYVCGKVFGIH